MLIVSINGTEAVAVEKEETVMALIDLMNRVAKFNNGHMPEVTFRRIHFVMGGGPVAVNSAFVAILETVKGN